MVLQALPAKSSRLNGRKAIIVAAPSPDKPGQKVRVVIVDDPANTVYKVGVDKLRPYVAQEEPATGLLEAEVSNQSNQLRLSCAITS